MFGESNGLVVARWVIPDRDKSPEKIVSLIECSRFVDAQSLVQMPRGERKLDRKKERIFLWYLGSPKTDEEVGEMLRAGKMRAADPYLLIQVNIDQPELSDLYPSATHWKDPRGDWNFCAFRTWSTGRAFYLHRHNGFPADCWIACVPDEG